MNASTVQVTAELSRFLSHLRFDDLPQAAMQAARRSMLDWLGCAILGSRQPGTLPLRTVLSTGNNTSNAQVVGHALRLGTIDAALVNGQAGHVLDFDSIHLGGVQLHAASPIFSALFALADSRKTSGRELVTAAVAGYEAGVRTGLTAPAHHAGGWHLTGTLGTIAAGAAGAKLLDLETGRYVFALGIAATQASGLQRNRGTHCKSLHAAKAAGNGVLSALLAEQGHNSALDIIEGENGFARVYSDEVHLEQALHDLGKRWEITANGFKPYACGIVLHPLIDAVIKLRQNSLASASSVDSIRLRVHPHVMKLTGEINPEAGLKAKFSVSHAAAVSYIDGAAGVLQFSDERAKDPEVIRLRSRISVDTDASLRRDEAEAWISIAGSTSHCKIEHATGTISNPMTDEALEAKFMANAGPVIGQTRAAEILGLSLDLERLNDVSRLATLSHP